MVLIYKGDEIRKVLGQPVTITDDRSNIRRGSEGTVDNDLKIISLNQEIQELKSLIELRKVFR